HQKIGILLSLAALASFGFSSNRFKWIFAIGAQLLAMLLIFHISARGALIALICSLIFLVFADVLDRSKKWAFWGAAAAISVAILASYMFYQHALHANHLKQLTGSDAVSRTIEEIQKPTPGKRQQIWADAWGHIIAEPSKLVFGRGIGMYPVDQ